LDFDFILVGAGLQNGLLALALLHRQPGLKIAVIEREPKAGGNHTWSFHAGDVPDEATDWLEPLVSHRWSKYQVRFPGFQRELSQPYSSIASRHFEKVLREKLTESPGCQLLTGTAAREVLAGSVVLDDGRTLEATRVVDARGPGDKPPGYGSGFQKFLGQELKIAAGPVPAVPLVMDATVRQDDGYRFVYLLPLAADRILVEDTYFSDTPDLDLEKLRQRIQKYLDRHDLTVSRLVREEQGVLPMPWQAGPQPDKSGPLVAGYAGGFFHPATGYSLPLAASLAELISRLPGDLDSALQESWKNHQRQARFARLLNRMLFRMVPSGQRWRIFRRFYRLPEASIRRFYALQTTRKDRARILIDHPPGLSFFRLPGR